MISSTVRPSKPSPSLPSHPPVRRAKHRSTDVSSSLGARSVGSLAGLITDPSDARAPSALRPRGPRASSGDGSMPSGRRTTSISACIPTIVASRCAIVASLSSTVCCSLVICAAAARASVACASRQPVRCSSRSLRATRSRQPMDLNGQSTEACGHVARCASREPSAPVQAQTWRVRFVVSVGGDACGGSSGAAASSNPCVPPARPRGTSALSLLVEPSLRRRRRGAGSGLPRSGLVQRTRSFPIRFPSGRLGTQIRFARQLGQPEQRARHPPQ